MTWVADKLQNGETVTFCPRGHSMEPLIKDGQEVTVAPLRPDMTIYPGMIVLCKVKHFYLHKVLAVGPRGFLIGNNKGHTNGWTRKLYGYVV